MQMKMCVQSIKEFFDRKFDNIWRWVKHVMYVLDWIHQHINWYGAILEYIYGQKGFKIDMISNAYVTMVDLLHAGDIHWIELLSGTAKHIEILQVWKWWVCSAYYDINTNHYLAYLIGKLTIYTSDNYVYTDNI